LAVALGQSIQPLSILFFIIMLGVLIFSSIMYYIERGNKQNGSNPNEQFGSIIQSMWWCVATISTVTHFNTIEKSV
jgi:magnesium-transporting ATPase (P-type)